MGASSSQLHTAMPIDKEWALTGPYSIPKLYTHSNGSVASEHTLALGPGKQQQKQMGIYSYRKHQRINLVRVYGVDTNSSCVGCCSSKTFMRVLVEYLPFRLADVPPYSFQEALYIISQTIPAAKDILKRVGAVRFEQAMFGVTHQGYVKVWVNPNFQQNHPEKSNRLTGGPEQNQKFMIKSLLNVVEYYSLGGQFPEHFIRQLESIDYLNFQNLQRVLQRFADANRIIIPNRLDMNSRKPMVVQEVVTTFTTPIGVIPIQPVAFTQPLTVRNSHQAVVINTSVLSPSEFVAEQRVSNDIGVMRHQESGYTYPLTQTTNSQFPITTHVLPLDYFPRHYNDNVANTIALPKYKFDGGSALTNDRTITCLNSNIVSNQSKLNNNPFFDSAIVQVPLDNNYTRMQVHGGSASLPLPQASQATYRRFESQRISMPFQQQTLTSVPNRNIVSTIYQPPRYDMIPMTQQMYTTPMKAQSIPMVQEVQEEIEEDMYLTTTTYKVHPNVTFQYRTTHPESVKLVPPVDLDPVITSIKLPRNYQYSASDRVTVSI